MEFIAAGKRLSVAEGTRGRSENWHQLIVEGTAPPGAECARLALVLHANGTAWFDDIYLWHPVPAQDRATLTLQPQQLITDKWQGFGCESDLNLYQHVSIAQGLDDKDRKLVTDRIRAMRPQIARLLFCVDFWEPKRGKRTPDSEGMKDLRETLAIFKEIGADVFLNEWGFTPPAWARPTGIVPHPEESRAYADSFVAAIKYLREDCGFTNIRYATMTNEPNGSVYPWKDYVRMCRALDESLKDADLGKDVAILGPDEANTYDWLPRAIAELDDIIDYYDAHNYTCDTGSQFVCWVAPRVGDMPKSSRPGLNPPRKRLMITEFGMHDGMDTFSTPHNHEYGYGIFLAESAIAGASNGASAMLMWCLMDTNYGNNRMKWGLWRFRDENWEPRPGFYSWSLITRYTERGSTVHPVSSDASDAVAVAFRAPDNGPWTILAVNRRKTARPFTLKGLPPKSRWLPYVYSEKTIPTADRGMIRADQRVQADSKGNLDGMLPLNSFVLWRQEAGD
jgi:alpha-galactosidase